MKTAKEKASELFDEYYLKLTKLNSMASIEARKSYSKQCALICVDEVLNRVVSFPTNLITYEYGEEKAFWKEVKQEIIKL